MKFWATSERHHWHGHLLLDLREHEATPREASWQQLADFSFFSGCSRWSLWFGFMGLRKDPTARSNRAAQANQMLDIPNRYGENALSAQLSVQGEGSASEHTEDSVLQSQDV